MKAFITFRDTPTPAVHIEQWKEESGIKDNEKESHAVGMLTVVAMALRIIYDAEEGLRFLDIIKRTYEKTQRRELKKAQDDSRNSDHH